MTYHWFLDRQGNPISEAEWARLRRGTNGERNRENIVVKQEHVGTYFVSTVWLGINHQYGEGQPLIFETMVFDDRKEFGHEDVYMERYATEAEAVAGHAIAVEWARTEGEQA